MDPTKQVPDPDLLFATDEEKTFSHQDDLPPLPVPDLHHTLERYLDSVKPHLTEEDYRHTEFIVQQFASGIGKDLHKKLLEKAKNSKNWLEKWWEDKAYLELRFPVSPFMNLAGPGPYMQHYWKPKQGTQVERAAFTTHYMTQYWRLLRTQRLKGDRGNKGEKFCMHQFSRAFSTCRVPGVYRDTLHTFFQTEEEGPSPNHIVVLHKGRVFYMDVVDDKENPLTPPELEISMQAIKDMCSNLPPGPGVATLTCGDRTTFAQLRSRLLALHPENYKNLELIQKSLFSLTLDDGHPQTESETVQMGLAGDPTNRWSDKSSNMIFFENGMIASHCDHAPVDGMVVVASTYYADLHCQRSKGKWQGDTKVRDLPKPKELVFHIDDVISSGMLNMKEAYLSHASNLITRSVHFTKYGRKFLRKWKLHPDTHVQMVLQYAYYKQYKRPAPTYETATTRYYYHGRTETMRTCTMESMAFCKTMCDINTSVQTRREAYLKAANNHNRLMEEAKQMKGCDRHLLGLSLIAQEENIPTPLLYQDKAFTKSGGGGNFVLSTSFVGYTTVCGGVAPMVDDGYGFFYHMTQDEIVFLVTSWKSSKVAHAEKFADVMHQCLRDVLPIITSTPATSAKL